MEPRCLPCRKGNPKTPAGVRRLGVAKLGQDLTAGRRKPPVGEIDVRPDEHEALSLAQSQGAGIDAMYQIKIDVPFGCAPLVSGKHPHELDIPRLEFEAE